MTVWRGFTDFLRRRERGGAVVEFALVVPILFLLVWGTLNFSRAYQRLNVLTAALREGARYGATMNPVDEDAIRIKVRNFSSAFGYPIDDTQLNPLGLFGDQVEVGVTNYELFSDLSFFGLSNIRVTRRAVFRWERAP
jgi:hypothetical protein